MAVAGRKPKPDDQKVTRHPLTQGWVDVENVPYENPPRLPPFPGKVKKWHSWTRRWWGVITRMPHCVLWNDADWEYVTATLPVADAYFKGDLRLSKELRDRERKLGMTLDDRRDLRIRYVEPQPKEDEPGGVTSLADYRAALVDE